MATKEKTTTKTTTAKAKAETGLKQLHQILRDHRKSVMDTRMEIKLGRIKNTSLVAKHKKEVARSLTKLNASRIIANLKK